MDVVIHDVFRHFGVDQDKDNDINDHHHSQVMYSSVAHSNYDN